MVLDRLLARGNDVAQVFRADPRAVGHVAPEDAIVLAKPASVLASVLGAVRLAWARVVNPNPPMDTD